MLLGGCATVGAPKDDPFEPWNRAMYKVHEAVDGNASSSRSRRPTSTSRRSSIRTGVSNFFGNIDDLFSGINDVLQGKSDKAGNDMGRVMLNTVFGFGGIIDIASDAGIEKGNEDFGQTFGYWGIPQGPYLFIPLFGPTHGARRHGPDRARLCRVRSTYVSPNVPCATSSMGSASSINARRRCRRETFVDQAALDRYTFVRRAYLQRARYLVYDGKPPPENEED